MVSRPDCKVRHKVRLSAKILAGGGFKFWLFAKCPLPMRTVNVRDGRYGTGGDFAAPTCHSFAAFPCPVAFFLPPPATLSRHFRARWHFFGLHLPHFRSIPEPGGMSAAPTCHSFADFLCQVACFRLHLSHFRGISVPGGNVGYYTRCRRD